MSDDELVNRIVDVVFPSVKFSEGYDMDSVDQLLDQLESAASRGQPLQPIVMGAQLPTRKWAEGYDKSEVDRFLADIAGLPPVTQTHTQSRTPEVQSRPVAPSVIEEKPSLMSRLFGRDR